MVRVERSPCQDPRSFRVERAWLRSRFPTTPPTREGLQPLEPWLRGSSALSLPPFGPVGSMVSRGEGTRYELVHFLQAVHPDLPADFPPRMSLRAIWVRTVEHQCV